MIVVLSVGAGHPLVFTTATNIRAAPQHFKDFSAVQQNCHERRFCAPYLRPYQTVAFLRT
jgi:hypothetical protein